MGTSRPFGTIRELPSGRFQARYWHLGKQVEADTTFGSTTEARTWLAQMETDLNGGRHVDPTSLWGSETLSRLVRQRFRIR